MNRVQEDPPGDVRGDEDGRNDDVGGGNVGRDEGSNRFASRDEWIRPPNGGVHQGDWKYCNIFFTDREEDRLHVKRAIIDQTLTSVGLSHCFTSSIAMRGNFHFRGRNRQRREAVSHPLNVWIDAVEYHVGNNPHKWYRPTVEYVVVFECEVIFKYRVVGTTLYQFNGTDSVGTTECRSLPMAMEAWERDVPHASVQMTAYSVGAGDEDDGGYVDSEATIMRARRTPPYLRRNV